MNWLKSRGKLTEFKIFEFMKDLNFEYLPI